MRLEDLPERIREKIYIEPNTGCWIWLGACNGTGGNYGVTNRGRKYISTHQFCYEFFRGSIQPGLELDHLCRTPCCCNPDHLEPVTPKVNINRGRRFNAEKTHCKRGHEFTPENTYINPSTDARSCRICNKERMKIYWKQHKIKVFRS